MKKLSILLFIAIFTGFITFTNSQVFAKGDSDGEYTDIDDVDLSNEEYDELADKGQIKDLKGRLTELKKLRKIVAGNLETAGDDVVDNTSLLSDIDRLISDIEDAKLGELTQGEYLELVKDHVSLIDTVKKYDTEMELASERGDLTLTDNAEEKDELEPIDVGKSINDDDNDSDNEED